MPQMHHSDAVTEKTVFMYVNEALVFSNVLKLNSNTVITFMLSHDSFRDTRIRKLLSLFIIRLLENCTKTVNMLQIL